MTLTIRTKFESKKIDIALIDSFVHGACTDTSSIQQNLNALIPQYKTVSFAQGGAGPLLELAYLKEYALRYRPDLVFWVWVANDLRNLQDELQSPLRFYLQDNYTQNLSNKIIKGDADEIVRKIIRGHALRELNRKGISPSRPQTIIEQPKNIKSRLLEYFPRTYIFLASLRYKLSKNKFVNTVNIELSRDDVLTRSLPIKEEKFLLRPAALF